MHLVYFHLDGFKLPMPCTIDARVLTFWSSSHQPKMSFDGSEVNFQVCVALQSALYILRGIWNNVSRVEINQNQLIDLAKHYGSVLQNVDREIQHKLGHDNDTDKGVDRYQR